MLVLSRKDGESIRIGKDIEIRILKSRGNRVQLGIRAPREVSIHRGELFDLLELETGTDYLFVRKDVATAS